MYLKKGGSHLNKDQPYLRNDMSFNKNYKMEKILECMYSDKHIAKWDVNIEKTFTLSSYQDKCHGILYMKNKK